MLGRGVGEGGMNLTEAFVEGVVGRRYGRVLQLRRRDEVIVPTVGDGHTIGIRDIRRCSLRCVCAMGSAETGGKGGAGERERRKSANVPRTHLMKLKYRHAAHNPLHSRPSTWPRPRPPFLSAEGPRLEGCCGPRLEPLSSDASSYKKIGKREVLRVCRLTCRRACCS